MRLQMQLDLASRRRHAQGTDQVQALIVLQTGAQGGRLPTRSPSPLQRRDERKARFIDKNEGGAPFTAVFLYAARHTASNGRWLFHLAPTRGAAVFENSSRDVAAGTTRCSNDSVRGTTARSDGQSDPASSNLRHSPTHMLRVSERPPTGAVGRPINDWGVPVGAHAAWAWDAGTRDATGTRSAESRQPLSQPASDLVRAVTRLRRTDDAVLIASLFQMVSCANYST